MGQYTDEDGYLRDTVENGFSTLIHRQKAYRNIYLKNRDKYPLPFEYYVVHHIDGDKKNNRLYNLEIMLPEEHEAIHGLSSPFYSEVFYGGINLGKSNEASAPKYFYQKVMKFTEKYYERFEDFLLDLDESLTNSYKNHVNKYLLGSALLGILIMMLWTFNIGELTLWSGIIFSITSGLMMGIGAMFIIYYVVYYMVVIICLIIKIIKVALFFISIPFSPFVYLFNKLFRNFSKRKQKILIE